MSGVAIPLLLTLKVAFTATLAALVAGVAAGWLLARTRFPGREALDAVLLLPMVLPPTVIGYYLLVVLGTHGAIGAWLDTTFGVRLVFSWQGAAIAAAVVAFPLVFKAARTAFESVDPNLEKAGRSLGYAEWRVLARITLPLAWRGIAAGAMLAFARATGEFGATLMIAGNIPGRTQTLSIAIYEAVQAGDDALANSLVVLASITCIVLLVAAAAIVRRGHLRIVPV
ncbi:MAG TPA: molybdate ABC transporter permease subunit [Casimicrobiaceae bacterium]|nr:molybdate ABC transporter permease subunit [Casimicrobiaceae bacterium]